MHIYSLHLHVSLYIPNHESWIASKVQTQPEQPKLWKGKN